MRVRSFLLATALVLSMPIVAIAGYIGYQYAVYAFPSAELAKERFEQGGAFEFPIEYQELYFRTAMASPLDQGGSALVLTTSKLELAKILNTQPRWADWQRLSKPWHCNCLMCLRYSAPISIPAGSVYWKREMQGSDYILMAVNSDSRQLFWCAQDT